MLSTGYLEPLLISAPFLLVLLATAPARSRGSAARLLSTPASESSSRAWPFSPRCSTAAAHSICKSLKLWDGGSGQLRSSGLAELSATRVKIVWAGNRASSGANPKLWDRPPQEPGAVPNQPTHWLQVLLRPAFSDTTPAQHQQLKATKPSLYTNSSPPGRERRTKHRCQMRVTSRST